MSRVSAPWYLLEEVDDLLDLVASLAQRSGNQRL